jgi:alpha-glucosidase
LLLEFPNDTLTYSIKDQFMLGPDLLVAPVITRGAVSRSVYFPEGQWINIWTKEKVEGNSTHIVSAPIGSPPVYIRQNSQWTDRLTQCLK